MEFKIENTQVFGIEKAIVASGNSYRTTIRNENELNEKDIARAEKLGQVDPGTGHDTFLKRVFSNYGYNSSALLVETSTEISLA